MSTPKQAHRWEWPASATRLSQWLTSKEIVELTRDDGAARGAKYGRVVSYRDGRTSCVAVVERREAQEHESGKWRYRLIDAASLSQCYLEIFSLGGYDFNFESPELRLKVALIERSEKLRTPCLLVYFSYNPEHVKWLKAQDAQWAPALKAWYFQDEREFDVLVPALKARFGVGQEQRYLNVTMSVEALLPTLLSYNTCAMFGRRVLLRDAQWRELVAGEQVRLVGTLNQGLVLEIMKVPSTLYAQEATRFGDYIRDVQVWSTDEIKSKDSPEVMQIPRALGAKLERVTREMKRSLPLSFDDFGLPTPGAEIEPWLDEVFSKLQVKPILFWGDKDL